MRGWRTTHITHMRTTSTLTHPGVQAALGAALLFGAGTPLAKLLLGGVNPWMLAGLLYLGSGLGLTLYRLATRATPVRPARGEWRWFIGALLAGGVLGPALLMLGLAAMPASGASLLLNAEGVFTALIAWWVFRENAEPRIVFGMLAIVAGAVVVGWPSDLRFAGAWPALAVLGACLAWAIDNNLTRKVSLTDASWIAATKGLVAGATNLVLALLFAQGESRSTWPGWPTIAGALVVGFFAYGLSLTLFVRALRALGTARTGAYFSVAPFAGAVMALALGEPVTWPLAVAGVLMAFGVWLHLTERHAHAHRHEPMAHEHAHVHDAHHGHTHGADDPPAAPGEPHRHAHDHVATTHTHAHFPDAHHGHRH